MIFSLFNDAPRVTVHVPRVHRQKQTWQPRMGDIFPDFQAPTTQGWISFHDWAEGRWTHLWNLGAAQCPDFLTGASIAERPGDPDGSLKSIALSRGDDVENRDWLGRLALTGTATVRFPIIADPQGILHSALGLDDSGVTHRQFHRSFLIDPAMRIRACLDYPTAIPRTMDELVRIACELRTVDGAKSRQLAMMV